MCLSSDGQRLREILAENGFEFTPDELDESIRDSVHLAKLKLAILRETDIEGETQ